MITIDLNKIKVKLGNKGLDAGCGSGRHMAAIYDKKKVHIIGMDFCFQEVKSAQNRMNFHEKIKENSYSNWSLCVADILSLPFKDNFFDFVICSEVLEHLAYDKEAIRELIRVLKPGKMLILSVPRYFPEKICWFLSKEYANSDQKHVRIYRKSNLIKIIKLFGLEYDHSHYSHSLHTPFWWLKCLIGIEKKNSFIINLYHKFLMWDLEKQPYITKLLDKIFNPFLGKSLVMYFNKVK